MNIRKSLLDATKNKDRRLVQLYEESGQIWPENISKHLSISAALEQQDKRESMEYKLRKVN